MVRKPKCFFDDASWGQVMIAFMYLLDTQENIHSNGQQIQLSGVDLFLPCVRNIEYGTILFHCGLGLLSICSSVLLRLVIEGAVTLNSF